MMTLTRAALVVGVVLAGLASGAMLGALVLYSVQWALADEPLFAEPLIPAAGAGATPQQG